MLEFYLQTNSEPSLCKRAVPYSKIDKDLFSLHMQGLQPPQLINESIDGYVKSINDTLHHVSKKCKHNGNSSVYNGNQKSCWKRILESKDEKALWRGINWKGGFNESINTDRPSDVEF